MKRPRAVRLRSTGPEDTRALAAAAARVLEAGDVVTLTGDLGAGKTCFVQGAAAALGVTERVTSPTFVLMRTYEGRLPVVHCDVYRLNRLAEVRDLGEDVAASDVVTFVEWGDAIAGVLPDDRLEIELHLVDDDPDVRAITARGHAGWAARLDDITTACAHWRVDEDARDAATGA